MSSLNPSTLTGRQARRRKSLRQKAALHNKSIWNHRPAIAQPVIGICPDRCSRPVIQADKEIRGYRSSDIKDYIDLDFETRGPLRPSPIEESIVLARQCLVAPTTPLLVHHMFRPDRRCRGEVRAQASCPNFTGTSRENPCPVTPAHAIRLPAQVGSALLVFAEAPFSWFCTRLRRGSIAVAGSKRGRRGSGCLPGSQIGAVSASRPQRFAQGRPQGLIRRDDPSAAHEHAEWQSSADGPLSVDASYLTISIRGRPLIPGQATHFPVTLMDACHPLRLDADHRRPLGTGRAPHAGIPPRGHRHQRPLAPLRGPRPCLRRSGGAKADWYTDRQPRGTTHDEPNTRPTASMPENLRHAPPQQTATWWWMPARCSTPAGSSPWETLRDREQAHPDQWPSRPACSSTTMTSTSGKMARRILNHQIRVDLIRQAGIHYVVIPATHFSGESPPVHRISTPCWPTPPATAWRRP